jgi:hypothetical protein
MATAVDDSLLRHLRALEARLENERQRIETFTNVRGRMVAGASFGLAESVTGEPFGADPVPVADILA